MGFNVGAQVSDSKSRFRITWLEPALLYEFNETDKVVSGQVWKSTSSYLPLHDPDAIWKPDVAIENARDFHDSEIVDQGMSPGRA